jgi:branched-chain amino acid transport system substrate-binding protein
VLGEVLHPLNTSDFSSFLLQAQSSKAKIVGLANAGVDTVNSIKQPAEFGIVAGGQRLAALLMTAAEVHGLGLQAAQGLVLTESYYWDVNDRTRKFGERFYKRTGQMPNMIQAGTYSATLQYLKGVKAAGTKDADAVAKKLKELPVDDAFTSHGKVQANGRMVSDLYLFQVKKPSESKSRKKRLRSGVSARIAMRARRRSARDVDRRRVGSPSRDWPRPRRARA